MLILPWDVSVCVANHQLLWHWVYPWLLGDSVQVNSRFQWESIQGQVCSEQLRPAHVFFYPQSTENASFPTTYLHHPQEAWLKSCICWGSFTIRRMNSGFNHCETKMRFCVFSSYIYVSWFTLWLFEILIVTSFFTVLLVSAVQQSESFIYIPPYFRFYSHVGYYKELNRVPCALQ